MACVYLALIPVIYINSLTRLELASRSAPRALRVSCDTRVRPHHRQLCRQVIAVPLAAQCEAGIWLAVTCITCVFETTADVLLEITVRNTHQN